MADNDDLRKKAEQFAERQKKAATREKLRRAKERFARVNAKIQLLQHQLGLAHQPQRKVSCQEEALAAQPCIDELVRRAAEQHTLPHTPPHSPQHGLKHDRSPNVPSGDGKKKSSKQHTPPMPRAPPTPPTLPPTPSRSA